MPLYIDSARVRIRGVDIDDRVISVSLGRKRGNKAVQTISPSPDPKGNKKGPFDNSLSIKAHPTLGPELPDWWDLQESGEEFDLVLKPHSNKTPGRDLSLLRCTVNDVSLDIEAGDGSLSVALHFCEFKRTKA